MSPTAGRSVPQVGAWDSRRADLVSKRTVPHTADMEHNKYAIALSELERTAHVPIEDQITEQAEPPHGSALAAEDLDRQTLLGITSAGRLRLP